MSELTVTLLRFGFLALLWVFILAVIASQSRDLGVGGRARAAVASARQRHEERSQQRRDRSSPRTPAPAPTTTGGTRHRPQKLVIVEGPLAGSTFQLGAAPVMLGRSGDVTVPLEDDYASGRHARLFPQGSRWFLEDMGSTNGTFVQGQKLTRAMAMEPGTPFRVGRTVMELRP